MAQRSRRLWTHGVATVVEFPDRPSRIQHAGWGTLVRQPHDLGDNNWFHLAVPTLTRLKRDDSMKVDDVRILLDLNENAVLNLVHLRHGGDLLFEHPLRLSNTSVDEHWEIPDTDANVGLCVSMRIKFLDGSPEGQVIFRGAAANFER